MVLSVGENLQEVAAWELSVELSPEAARARYLGAFSLGFGGQKVIGPSLLVVVLMPTGRRLSNTVSTWKPVKSETNAKQP